MNDTVDIFQKPRLLDEAIPNKARSKNRCRKVERGYVFIYVYNNYVIVQNIRMIICIACVMFPQDPMFVMRAFK